MNDAADESGVREATSGLNKSLKAAANPLDTATAGVKSAASSLTDLDPDSETAKLAAKREEDVKKIQAATARAAGERKQREAAEALARADALEAELKPAKKAPAKKSAAKKAPAKKAPAKKPAAKKPAAKKAPAKKSSK